MHQRVGACGLGNLLLGSKTGASFRRGQPAASAPNPIQARHVIVQRMHFQSCAADTTYEW